MARDRTENAKQRSSIFSGPADIAGPRLALVVAVFFLSVIGLVVVYSASSIEAINEGLDPSAYFVRQAAYMLVSVAICALLAVKVPYDVYLGRVLDAFWLATIALLLLTALIGTVGLGAQRWLSLGPVSFQPSEFAKVAFILMMARIMYRAGNEKMDFSRLTAQVVALVIVPVGVLFLTQSDLGTTLICLVGILAVAYFSGLSLRTMALVAAGMLAFALAAVLLRGYRSERLSFLDPEADYYGSGYQLARSFYAFGEGGLFGVGLGNSTEKYLYLPEAETDFIFAIVAEEMGFVGALAVVLAFLVILWAGLRIAKSAPDLYGSMIAGASTVMLVFQAFLNIACVTGILPTTGKPLPFISSGGSSLLGSFLLVGIILSVSFAAEGVGGIYDRRRSGISVVRGRKAAARSGRAGR